MAEIQRPIPENNRPHETVQNSGEFVGMQARLLLGGDLLNPEQTSENPIDEVLLSSQKTLEQRSNTTYTYLANASQNERRAYWENQPARGFAEQKRQWAESVAKTFSDSRDFFQNSQQGQEWNTLFIKLGINAVSATADTAQQFYSTYLAKQDSGATLRGFVASVIQAHTENDTPDYAKLQKNLPAIQWLSNMFGKNSSEVITQLIDAEVRIQNDQQAPILVEQVNTGDRINQLTDQEKRLLSFVWRGKINSEPATESHEQNTTPPSEETVTEAAATEENNNELTPQQIADKLMSYDTGEIKDEKVDLLPSFSELVETVTHLAESKRFQADGPVMILSDVAWAMMEKIASSSNNKNKELGFAVRGLSIYRNSDSELTKNSAEIDLTKTILIGAFTSPSMHFPSSEDTKTFVSPDVENPNSLKLSENTNLSSYFQTKGQFAITNGESLASFHTHQESLGSMNWITPSLTDYQTEERITRELPIHEHYWAVVTKARGKLMINLIRTSIDKDGKAVHKEHIPCLPESELYQRLRKAA